MAPVDATYYQNSPGPAAWMLRNLILGQLDQHVQLHGLQQVQEQAVRRWVKEQLNIAVGNFDIDNTYPTVEAHMTFWGYRDDDKLAWKLKVIWDADDPPQPSSQEPHFGYEIEFNDRRVSIGHVWFPRAEWAGAPYISNPTPGAPPPNQPEYDWYKIKRYRVPCEPVRDRKASCVLEEKFFIGNGRVDVATRYFEHGGQGDARFQWPPASEDRYVDGRGIERYRRFADGPPGVGTIPRPCFGV